jgi:hypothetical protein
VYQHEILNPKMLATSGDSLSPNEPILPVLGTIPTSLELSRRYLPVSYHKYSFVRIGRVRAA